jgi:hypothetical protein
MIDKVFTKKRYRLYKWFAVSNESGKKRRFERIQEVVEEIEIKAIEKKHKNTSIVKNEQKGWKVNQTCISALVKKGRLFECVKWDFEAICQLW